MKKHLLSGLPLLLLTSSVWAQTQVPQNVSGNVNVSSAATNDQYAQGENNPGGNVNLLGDLVFKGTNNWILHTPNDNGRTSLYLAPGSQWARQTRFDANGDVAFSPEGRVSIGNVTCASGVTCPGRLGINNLSLAVGGKIGARYGIHVVNVGVAWPDYVFTPAYTLASLTEVAAFIEANHHLPDLPSAAEVQAEGVELVSMQAALLRKVEELTLHLIRLEEQNRALQVRVQQLEN